MSKEYWRKCTKCGACAHYRDEVWKGERWEACRRFGYRLWPELEPADDCEGYESPSLYTLRMQKEKKRKKSKTETL